MAETLSLVVKNDLAEIPRLAEIISKFCSRHGLSPDVEFDLNLSLDEVVVNVIRHGYRDHGPHEIGVSFTLEGGLLTVSDEDDGTPFNPLEAPPPNLNVPIEERQPGGLGIHLVKNLMDELQYQRRCGRNVLTMKKNLWPH